MNDRMNAHDVLWPCVSALLALSLLAFAGCARFTSSQGVDNLWRGEDVAKFEVGKTLRADVLDALGPPSQIITVGEQTVFYYLREYGRGEAMVLLVYNSGNVSYNYDRAVFFFDPQGLLTEFSYSMETAPED